MFRRPCSLMVYFDLEIATLSYSVIVQDTYSYMHVMCKRAIWATFGRCYRTVDIDSPVDVVIVFDEFLTGFYDDF